MGASVSLELPWAMMLSPSTAQQGAALFGTPSLISPVPASLTLQMRRGLARAACFLCPSGGVGWAGVASQKTVVSAGRVM